MEAHPLSGKGTFVRKAVNQWCFPREMTVGQCALLAKECGFEGIELCLEEMGELSLETSVRTAGELAREVSGTGVSVPSIATKLYWKFSATSGDPGVCSKVLSIARKQIEFARVFGAGTILYLPGSVYFEDKPISYLVAYERAKEMLREIAQIAAANGVRVGVENVWNNFLMSPREMGLFLDEVGSSSVGAYVDTGNALVYGQPEDWIVTLGSRLVMVHFKDFKSDIRSFKGFAGILQGDVDWPAVMSALAEVEYRGYVIAEFVTPYRYCGDQLVRDLSAAMDRVLYLHK